MQLRLKSTKLYTSLVGFPRTPRSTRITWRNRTKGRDFLDLGFELNIFLRDVMENIIKQDGDNTFSHNRPFYRYGGHIELIRFKEYYGMPRGYEPDPIYSLSIYSRFSGQFFFKFSQKRLQWEKEIVVPFFYVIMIAFFPRNTQ